MVLEYKLMAIIRKKNERNASTTLVNNEGF